MVIIKNYKHIIQEKLRQPVIATVGIFDGVHLGHRHIIAKCVDKARQSKGSSILITFYPHPLKRLNTKLCPPLIMSLEQRLKIFEELGVDLCVIINFTKIFAGLSAVNFVHKVLIKRLRIKELFIGYNFRFGFKAKGDINLLKKISRQAGLKVTIVREVKVKGRPISSTAIRRLTEEGKLSEAGRLLGKPYSIYGVVVKGEKRGAGLGFPTANIKTYQEVLPPNGVYAVMADIEKRCYMGMLNIGTRPTFLKTPHSRKMSKLAIKPEIEVHLFGVNRFLYGKEMEIFPVKKIRDERKFKDRHSLMERLRKDSVIAKAILVTLKNLL